MKTNKRVLDSLPGMKVRHVGVLELDDFYRWMKRWFKFRGYWDSENNEKLYAEEIVGEGVKHIEIKWETQKKQSPNVIGKIGVSYTLIAVTTQKINVEGTEVKVYKGDFEIAVSVAVERVGELSFWRTMYDNVINKSSTDQYVNGVFEDGIALVSEIKQIFNQYA